MLSGFIPGQMRGEEVRIDIQAGYMSQTREVYRTTGCGVGPVASFLWMASYCWFWAWLCVARLHFSVRRDPSLSLMWQLSFLKKKIVLRSFKNY